MSSDAKILEKELNALKEFFLEKRTGEKAYIKSDLFGEFIKLNL